MGIQFGETVRKIEEQGVTPHLGITRTRRAEAALAARYTRWVAGR